MKSNRRIAETSVLCGLAAVIMYVCSLFGKIDIAAAVVASVCVGLVLGKYGYAYGMCSYAAVAVLTIIVLPAKTAPAIFAAFFGYYPVLKLYSESNFSKVRAWISKYAVMNVSVAVLIFIASGFVKIGAIVIAVVFLCANVLLPVYDKAYAAAVCAAEKLILKRFR